MEEDKRGEGETGAGAQCFLASQDADGSVRSIGPFPRERAEALVGVYGRMYPNQTCWVEALPEQVRALHLGRVRRLRSLPVLTPSDRDQ
jgi:hypothetical protein